MLSVVEDAFFTGPVFVHVHNIQWRKKMFLDRGADLPKEPRRYCGILFLILRVWFFSGDGGGWSPPSPPASYASDIDYMQ